MQEEDPLFEDIQAFQFQASKKKIKKEVVEKVYSSQKEEPPSSQDKNAIEDQPFKSDLSIAQATKTRKKPQKKTPQGPTTIQVSHFKYLWNVLRSKQDSEVVTLKDLTKAFQIYMKEQVPEELLIEMLNISNKILYEVDDVDHDMLAKEISEDDLREIFFSSKLKL